MAIRCVDLFAGEREQPSVAEFIAELPAFIWPVGIV